ncbi:hypothetical protein NM208_g4621 [Fusarium decemcellulare]|uniref:Uncharacterized protein n=1 Tax=Fusarium decemcellulare TaxID=57161 RepID=A0ACC1SK25_9HYPO|nr:hypothetical protein NM208_g4621 [Fusarium decemcellulare]
MISLPSKEPILIVCAGPGGLTLAQALRKRQIPYRVFERDSDPEARGQGWALALHWSVMTTMMQATRPGAVDERQRTNSNYDRIIPDLMSNFPDDLPPIETLSHLYERGEPSEGALFKGTTCEEITRFSSPDGKGFIRAARPKLRQWLARNIDVEWGMKLLRYDVDEAGVTAHFADGRAVKGCMLIGADGSNSEGNLEALLAWLRRLLYDLGELTCLTVRNLLLGPEAAKLHVHQMDVYVGMTQLSKAQYEYQFRNFARSLYVVEAPTAHLFTGLRSISPDGETADYYWMVFRHLTEAEKHIKNRSIDDWSDEEILNAALDTVQKINPRFNEVVWLTKPEGIHRPALYMEDFLPPPEGFGGNLVTLLGDAAHKMTPFKGEGGNHAMKDAIDFVSLLDSGIDDVSVLIKAYEELMLKRARDAVERTRAAAMDWVNHSTKGAWQEKLKATSK